MVPASHIINLIDGVSSQLRSLKCKRGRVRQDLPIAMVASLRCRVFASATAKLGVAHNTGICAVEENVFDVLILQVGPLQDRLQIRFGEA